MIRNEWDGIDRRANDRRRTVRYEERRIHDDEMDTAVVERERVIEVQAPTQPESTTPKWLSSSLMIPIIFSLITTVSGFVFNLYNRVTALEYKQGSIVEKVDEIKSKFKEDDTAMQKMTDHINSVESTVMEIFRQKKQQ